MYYVAPTSKGCQLQKKKKKNSRQLHMQEVFHVYLNKFENAVTHLFLVKLGNY